MHSPNTQFVCFYLIHCLYESFWQIINTNSRRTKRVRETEKQKERETQFVKGLLQIIVRISQAYFFPVAICPCPYGYCIPVWTPAPPSWFGMYPVWVPTPAGPAVCLSFTVYYGKTDILGWLQAVQRIRRWDRRQQRWRRRVSFSASRWLQSVGGDFYTWRLHHYYL